MSDSVTPWTAAHQVSLSSIISWSLLKFVSIDSVMLSDHLILCQSLLLLLSVFPSIRVFSSKSAVHIKWSKYYNFSFSISPFNEYWRLIYFRIDRLNLLQSKRPSRIFSSTTIWKHKFFGIQPSLWSNSHICTWLLEKLVAFDYRYLCQQNDVSAL